MFKNRTSRFRPTLGSSVDGLACVAHGDENIVPEYRRNSCPLSLPKMGGPVPTKTRKSCPEPREHPGTSVGVDLLERDHSPCSGACCGARPLVQDVAFVALRGVQGKGRTQRKRSVPKKLEQLQSPRSAPDTTSQLGLCADSKENKSAQDAHAYDGGTTLTVHSLYSDPCDANDGAVDLLVRDATLWATTLGLETSPVSPICGESVPLAATLGLGTSPVSPRWRESVLSGTVLSAQSSEDGTSPCAVMSLIENACDSAMQEPKHAWTEPCEDAALVKHDAVNAASMIEPTPTSPKKMRAGRASAARSKVRTSRQSTLDFDSVLSNALSQVFLDLKKENRDLRRSHRQISCAHQWLLREYARVRDTPTSLCAVELDLGPDMGPLPPRGRSLEEENRQLHERNVMLTQTNKKLQQAVAQAEAQKCWELDETVNSSRRSNHTLSHLDSVVNMSPTVQLGPRKTQTTADATFGSPSAMIHEIGVDNGRQPEVVSPRRGSQWLAPRVTPTNSLLEAVPRASVTFLHSVGIDANCASTPGC